MRGSSKNEQLMSLRKVLQELIRARHEGVSAVRVARAQGYADGFMASLMAAGTVTQRELLSIIAEERSRVSGPAYGSVRTEMEWAPA